MSDIPGVAERPAGVKPDCTSLVAWVRTMTEQIRLHGYKEPFREGLASIQKGSPEVCSVVVGSVIGRVLQPRGDEIIRGVFSPWRTRYRPERCLRCMQIFEDMYDGFWSFSVGVLRDRRVMYDFEMTSIK